MLFYILFVHCLFCWIFCWTWSELFLKKNVYMIPAAFGLSDAEFK